MNMIHLSDEVLLQLVSESDLGTTSNDAETHISECEYCQSRLLAVAAKPEWRAEAAANLSSGLGGLREDSRTVSMIGRSEPTRRSGHEFDLASVDQLLKEILAPPTHPETLGQLGRFEIESVLGCGGMGVVLKGYDRDLQRPVAIKLVLPRLAKNGTAKQRFAREARAAAAVLHPNVIAIHGIDETKGVPWFAMPLIVGPSLRELVGQRGPLPEQEVAQIAMQMASGLAAAHSQGLVHRDIKPENILIDNQVNRVVITDFGLARRESEEPMTQTGMVAGTLSYMSPEQSAGDTLDGRSDLFSLGSVLFYLATGVSPFQANNALGIINKISNQPHANVRELNPQVSVTLAAIIDRLLEKEPERRFQTASEVEAVVTKYVNYLNQPTIADAPSLKQIRPPVSMGNVFKMACALVVTAMALVGVGWAAYPFLFPEPTPISAEVLWADIQNEFQFTDPTSLENNLYKLGREFQRATTELGDSQIFENTKSAEELRTLSFQVRDFGEQLKRLEH